MFRSAFLCLISEVARSVITKLCYIFDCDPYL